MEPKATEEWIALACPKGNGFTLSPEFIQAVGPLWGTSWKAKAFVAHLVGFFNDSMEHLLDFPPDSDTDEFDVEPQLCAEVAARYREEFLDLPAVWYRSVFRARLSTLRVPKSVITEAKLSHFKKYYDHVAVLGAFANFVNVRVGQDGAEVVAQARRLLTLSVEEAWLAFEEVVSQAIYAGIVNSSDICELFGDLDSWETPNM